MENVDVSKLRIQHCNVANQANKAGTVTLKRYDVPEHSRAIARAAEEQQPVLSRGVYPYRGA